MTTRSTERTPAPPVHPRMTSRPARRRANIRVRFPSTPTRASWPEPTTRVTTTLPAKAIPQSPATGRAQGKRSTLRNPDGIESLSPRLRGTSYPGTPGPQPFTLKGLNQSRTGPATPNRKSPFALNHPGGPPCPQQCTNAKKVYLKNGRNGASRGPLPSPFWQQRNFPAVRSNS